MAQKIIRLPRSLSRFALRLANAVVTFVFMVFAYATGQVSQTVSSEKQAGQGGLAGLMKILNGANPDSIRAVTPVYGVTPDYGIIIEYGPAYVNFAVKGTIKSKIGNQAIENITVLVQDTARKQNVDSAATAQDGSFAMIFRSIPISYTWILKAKDAQGAFKEKDTLITIPSGTSEIDVSLYLDANATAVAPGSGKIFAGQPEVKVTRLGSGTMSVHYTIAGNGRARVALYGASGALVKELADKWHAAGESSISFESSGLAAGTYFLKVQDAARAVIAKISIAR